MLLTELYGIIGLTSIAWLAILYKQKKQNEQLIIRNQILASEKIKAREELTSQCELFAKTIKTIMEVRPRTRK